MPLGSGSFHQQAKELIKSLFLTVLWPLINFPSLKTDVNGSTVSNKQKNLFFVGFFTATDERGRRRIRIWICNRVYGSKDPYLSHNVTNPEHWLLAIQVFMYTIAFKHSANNFVKNARFSFCWSSSIGEEIFPRCRLARNPFLTTCFFNPEKKKRSFSGWKEQQKMLSFKCRDLACRLFSEQT